MATAKEALKGMLLDVNDDTDVTFMVHGTEFKAHKCVLNARSVVLKAIIAKPPINGKYLIDDPKVTPEVFQEFIKFLYLDECDIDFGNLDSMLHMSKIYEVPSLKESCIIFSRVACRYFPGAIEIGEIGIRNERYCPEIIRCVIEKFRSSFRRSFFYVNDTSVTILASKELVEKIVNDFPRKYQFQDEALYSDIQKWVEKICIQERGKIEQEYLEAILSPIKSKLNLLFSY